MPSLAMLRHVALRSMRRLLLTANIPSSPILVTLMKKAISYSETSVLTRATQSDISEDVIHHHGRMSRPSIEVFRK
jgi:hypothetical protein